jgi:Family of unknown function (DUF6524)
MGGLTPGGFLVRLAAAAAVVFCTFNPTGHSYAHWVAPSLPRIEPLQAVAGLGLLIGWILHLRATIRSLGILGVVVAAAFMAALVWLFISWRWIDMERSDTVAWVVLSVVTVLLAVGVSWSHVRRRVTGQADVTDVDPR